MPLPDVVEASVRRQWEAWEQVGSSQWFELMRVAQHLLTQVTNPFRGIRATRRGQASWTSV